MTLRTIGGRRWWVPAEYSERLAVQIDREEDYEAAIERKLIGLIERAGPLSSVEPTVVWIMGMHGVRLDPADDSEHLARQCIWTLDIGERIREGSPRMATPATVIAAVAAVEAQAELTLEDFLG